MFRFQKKRLIYPALFLASLVAISTFTSLLRILTVDILKYPLNFLSLIRHEITGVIFYHRNMLQSKSLRTEVDLLTQKLNMVKEVELENQRLKKILSFKQSVPYKVIAARVIGHASDNWSSVIIIDKGRIHGIKRGFVAVNYLGLAGRIIETTASTSKVMLINDPNLAVSGLSQRSRQEGLVSGALGSSLVMRYLPMGCDIKVSDIIITAGLTEAYPKGLLIGTVTHIGDEFSGLSRYAIIKPAVELSNIEEVLIIIP